MVYVPPVDMMGYQRKAVNNATGRRSLLRQPYGTGKSWTSLEIVKRFRHVLGHTHPAVAIIICRGHLMLTWQLELARRYPTARVQSLADYDPLEVGSADYVIVPHSQLFANLDLIRELLARHRYSSIIFDELQRIKNPKANITVAALALAEYSERIMSDSCLRVGLSGNPTPESPENIWSQFEFLYPGYNPFGPTFYRFLNFWFLRAGWQWALKLALIDEFWQTMRDWSVGFDNQDAEEFEENLGITDRVFTIERYQLSLTQKRLLREIEDDWTLTDAKGDLIIYNHVMAIAQKRQQVCSGFYYDKEGGTTYLRSNPKAELLADIVDRLMEEDPTRKIIVWIVYDADRSIVSNHLTDVVDSSGVMYGPDAAAIEDFMDHGQVIVMPMANAEGLNELGQASVNIFYNNLFSNNMRTQAEARIERLKHRKGVSVNIDLAADEARDMEVVMSLQSKNMNNQRLMDIFKKRAAHV